MCVDTQLQRFQTLEQHPGIEGGQGRTGRAQVLEDLLGQLLRAAHGAAEHPALAIEELGRRMDDQIGAQFERALQDGRAETVVDGDQDALGVGCRGQRPNIGNFRQRVGRRFEEEQFRFRTNGCFPGGGIGLRHKGGADAGARQDVREKLDGRPEQSGRGHDVVAVLQVGEDQGHDRRHAARRGDAVLGTLERGEAFLEHGHRRIGETGVDVARFLAGKTPGRLRGALENEAGGQVQRFRMLAELTALLTGANRQRLRSVAWGVGHQSRPSRASCSTSCCAPWPSPSSSSLPDLPPRLPSMASR